MFYTDVTLVGFWVYRNLESVLVLAFELHHSINEGVDSVVVAEANIAARVNLRAILTDDDVASDNLLTTELLYTKAFRI